MAVALLAGLASCTLTRTQVDECSSNADCRTAFGIGSVCGGDGICEKAPPNPRCTRTFPEDLLTRPESYPNALVYGSLVVSNIESQKARENATRLAITQANEQQGLDGHLFGIVFCDVAEDPKYDSLKRTDAVVATGRYLADVVGAPAFVGPSASPDVLAVFDAVKPNDVLVISPSATSPELTTRDIVPTATDERPGLLWRTAVPDTVQGVIIARHLDTLVPAVSSVAIVFEKGAYGEGLERVFRGAFEKPDGTSSRSPSPRACRASATSGSSRPGRRPRSTSSSSRRSRAIRARSSRRRRASARTTIRTTRRRSDSS